ncbi:MAG: hypothetical protein KAX49_13085 [Halanaerobiales bacterium]|nr:hypothetical protein [Halanaerobiales bacterium]
MKKLMIIGTILMLFLLTSCFEPYGRDKTTKNYYEETKCSIKEIQNKCGYYHDEWVCITSKYQEHLKCTKVSSDYCLVTASVNAINLSHKMELNKESSCRDWWDENCVNLTGRNDCDIKTLYDTAYVYTHSNHFKTSINGNSLDGVDVTSNGILLSIRRVSGECVKWHKTYTKVK